MMSAPHNDEEDRSEVFLDEEDLPNVEDKPGSDAEDVEEADDSMHLFASHTSELYTVACSQTDAMLVATGGWGDKGFLWMIGQGDWAFELQGLGSWKTPKGRDFKA